MKMKRDISGEFARDVRTRSVQSGFNMVKVENTMSYTFDEPSFVELCDCHENHVELLEETVEHVKREYYWIVKVFICMNCEMSWIKRTYCVGKGDNWEITQLPTGEEE